MDKLVFLSILFALYFQVHCYPQTTKTLYFDAYIDNFNHNTNKYASITPNVTFKLRYLIDESMFKQGEKAFILFYTGNESPVTVYADNSGYLYEVATTYSALLVFGEHRYFGESFPWGTSNFTNDQLHWEPNRPEQALADYAHLITYLKDQYKINYVILNGGSYGAMLSSWMKVKYPHLITGALACSAPLIQLEGGFNNASGGMNVVSQDFSNFTDCGANIKEGYKRLLQEQWTEQQLKDAFSICQGTTVDATTISSWLENAWVNSAMVDYPYATSFLVPLPPWPVKEECGPMEAWNSTKNDTMELFNAMKESVAFYYNSTQPYVQCYDLSDPAGGNVGYASWNYLVCSNIIMPMSTDGSKAIFPDSPWDINAFIQSCKSQFPWIYPQTEFSRIFFGAEADWEHLFRNTGNILFTNGDLDLWMPGGVITPPNQNIDVILMHDSAHHNDMRTPDPADPPDVIKGRELWNTCIKKWIGITEVEYI